MTLRPQLGIPLPITLERAARRVECVAVDLDDQIVLSPVEVDLEAAYPHVRSRLGQPGSADQLEESSFRFRSCERRLRPDRVAERSRSPVPGVTAELLIERKVCDL
jgi:hypothetical protein